MRPSQNLREDLEQLFEKKFQYQKPKNEGLAWLLPKEEQPSFREFYQYHQLQELKEQLNSVKSKLNDYGVQEWSSHTNRRDPSGEVPWRLKNETKAEFVTVAWCKIFECLNRYPLVAKPVLNTLHLCEAPGAFIAAINHYLHSTYDQNEIKWRWRSTTLNPYYEGNALNEMVTDDRFIFHTLDNWLFHKDLTGNLINVDNIEHMTQRCQQNFADNGNGGVDLVTADGSIDCAAQPDCQEEIVVRLFVAEIISGLSILQNGGNFVIKMFTLFEACSVSLLYLLNCVFQMVHLYKPATSKRGNSEVYVICLDYQKQTTGLKHLLGQMSNKLAHSQDSLAMPLFAKSQIPKDFLMQHEIACRLYMKHQVDAIEASIYAFESKDRNYLRYLHDLRGLVSDMYYQRYKVRKLAPELCIVPKEQTNQALGYSVPIYGGSYTEREHLRQGDLLQQLYCLRREFNQLEKCPCPSGLISYQHVKSANGTTTLEVTRGAAVKQLESSLFASEPVMLLRLRILETFQLDPLWQTQAKCLLGQKVLSYVPPAEQEHFHLAQQRFFVKLLNQLLELRPKEMVFQQFWFLSHYAVSLLLWLAENVYQEMRFEQNLITLSVLKDDDDQKKQLEQVLELLKKDDKTAIHSLIDIRKMQKNAFNQALIQHNNHLLMSCFRGMLGEDSFPRALLKEETNPSIEENKTIEVIVV